MALSSAVGLESNGDQGLKHHVWISRKVLVLTLFSEMTAEYACTRKQFNRKLSEFGLIQVLMPLGSPYGWETCACWVSVLVPLGSALGSRRGWADIGLLLMLGLILLGSEASDFVSFSPTCETWVSAHNCMFSEHARKSLH